jgi:hypothetical protein
MAVADRAFVSILVVVVGGTLTAGCGSGDEEGPGTYATQWRAVDPRGVESQLGAERLPKFSRGGRSLPITIEDGSCSSDEKSVAAVPKRLDHVRVAETPQAVYVTVFMRSEKRNEDVACGGVGKAFTQVVHLRHPVGRRAVIDAGSAYDPAAPFVYRALDAEVRHALERRYAARDARRECRDEAPVLAEKYNVRTRSRRKLAAAVASLVSRAARHAAFKACIAGFAQRDRARARE